jgi:hypothetical protein
MDADYKRTIWGRPDEEEVKEVPGNDNPQITTQGSRGRGNKMRWTGRIRGFGSSGWDSHLGSEYLSGS